MRSSKIIATDMYVTGIPTFLIAIVEFNYSFLNLLCVPQTHDLPVSSIFCMVALDFQLKSFTTLHNTTMKKLH